jgi:hypothetical protein
MPFELTVALERLAHDQAADLRLAAMILGGIALRRRDRQEG